MLLSRPTILATAVVLSFILKGPNERFITFSNIRTCCHVVVAVVQREILLKKEDRNNGMLYSFKTAITTLCIIYTHRFLGG